MVVMDERFGAEIITVKGKIFKFDDVICMIRFMKSGTINKKDIDRAFAMNYLLKNSFINVDQAVFLLSPELHSPMNGNTAAFINSTEASEVAEKMKGDLLNWSELYNKLN
jgi:copper chaperone NosL